MRYFTQANKASNRLMPRLGLAALLVLPGLATGQMINASLCTHLDDRLARFDCYEALVEEALVEEALVEEARQPGGEALRTEPRETVASPPSAALPQEPVATEPVATEEWVPPVRETRAERATRKPAEEPKREYRGLVAELSEYGHRMWQITLADGQVWRQMISKRYPLREGHSVRIYPSGFGGAFRLSADEVSGFIQVERVQ